MTALLFSAERFIKAAIPPGMAVFLYVEKGAVSPAVAGENRWG